MRADLQINLEAGITSGGELEIEDVLGVGRSVWGTDVYRSFIRFDVSEIESDVIDSATLYLTGPSCSVDQGELRMYVVLDDWDEQIEWFVEPEVGGEPIFSEGTPCTVGGIDVTGQVQAWADEPTENFGLALYGDEEFGSAPGSSGRAPARSRRSSL